LIVAQYMYALRKKRVPGNQPIRQQADDWRPVFMIFLKNLAKKYVVGNNMQTILPSISGHILGWK
jgi:hypothetical protein